MFLLKELQEPSNKDGGFITPPGVVPRRDTYMLVPKTAAASNKPYMMNRLSRSEHLFERPFSVSSHRTFVLENDTRKPLIARDPFKSGFSFSSINEFLFDDFAKSFTTFHR